jgi:hypothetical protein
MNTRRTASASTGPFSADVQIGDVADGASEVEPDADLPDKVVV